MTGEILDHAYGEREELAYGAIYQQALSEGMEPRKYIEQLESEGWRHYADRAGMWRSTATK